LLEVSFKFVVSDDLRDAGRIYFAELVFQSARGVLHEQADSGVFAFGGEGVVERDHERLGRRFGGNLRESE